MNHNNHTVTNDKWGVSVNHTWGEAGYTLHVYRFIPDINSRHMMRGEGYGKVFSTESAAWSFAEEKGYTKRYGRNTCRFVSSRAFRKHTGRTAIDPQHWQWLSMVRRGEQLRNEKRKQTKGR